MMDLSVFEGPSPAGNDFRSDTFTTPTSSMILSLAETTLGDSVYNEDKKTIELENMVAEIAGKEAGLYCVSGTLSNQIALRTNLYQPPYSIMCDYRSHVLVHEAGGIATLSQAMTQVIRPKNDRYMTLEDDIVPNFVPDDGEIHGAPTKLISLENSLHGMIYPLDEIKKISEFCKENDVKLHLDGARLWNVSAATGIPMKEYCAPFDSVSLCLSKTLGAPVGSVLVSSKKFIFKANHFRKQNGGGIRQSGLLASMAICAIKENFPKLKRTHEMAKEVGDLCKEIGIPLEHPVETNFVFVDFVKAKIDNDVFSSLGAKYGITVYGSRLAFHYQTTEKSLQSCMRALSEAYEDAKSSIREASGATRFYSAK